jgi:hypothetical protein
MPPMSNRLKSARASILSALRPRSAALLVVGATIAILSASHSLAQIGERSVLSGLGPIGQHSSGPLRSVAMRLASQRQIGSTDSVRGAVRETLAIAPLDAAAVRTAALLADREQKREDAFAGMNLANRLSRRDGVAQLWLINDGVRRRDVATVLRSYDVVLRTLPGGSRPLLENLARTLAIPQMRTAFAPYVNDTNPWFNDLAEVAVSKPETAYAFGQMLAAARTLPDTVALRGHYGAATRAVADRRDFALLGALYRRLPEARAEDAQSLTLPGGPGTQYLPIGWLLRNDGSYGAWAVGTPSAPEMELFAEGGIGGVVASKLLLLPPGRFQLRWTLAETPQLPDAEARLIATCIGREARSPLGEALLGSIAGVADGGTGEPQPQSRSLSISVGQDCGATMIDLSVRGGTGTEEARWLVSRMAVMPVREGR